MDVKFLVEAECFVENIECKAGSNSEVAKSIEELFESEGIKAVVEIFGLTYINESEGE